MYEKSCMCLLWNKYIHFCGVYVWKCYSWYTCLAFVYKDNYICFKIVPERSPRTIHLLFSGSTPHCILLVIKLRPMCANTLSFSLDLWIIFIIAAAYSLLYGVYNFMQYSLLYVSFAFLLSWFYVHLYSVNLTFLNY